MVKFPVRIVNRSLKIKTNFPNIQIEFTQILVSLKETNVNGNFLKTNQYLMIIRSVSALQFLYPLLVSFALVYFASSNRCNSSEFRKSVCYFFDLLIRTLLHTILTYPSIDVAFQLSMERNQHNLYATGLSKNLRAALYGYHNEYRYNSPDQLVPTLP